MFANICKPKQTHRLLVLTRSWYVLLYGSVLSVTILNDIYQDRKSQTEVHLFTLRRLLYLLRLLGSNIFVFLLSSTDVSLYVFASMSVAEVEIICPMHAVSMAGYDSPSRLHPYCASSPTEVSPQLAPFLVDSPPTLPFVTSYSLER